jgi:hypothetical protein
VLQPVVEEVSMMCSRACIHVSIDICKDGDSLGCCNLCWGR